MPAQVPPGYTRGPLLFLTTPAPAAARNELLQTIWHEAGAYGARLLLLAAEPAQAAAINELTTLLQSWECERVRGLLLAQRSAALDPALPAWVEEATGIVLLGEDPLHLASTLGGTPLAQAIRRANARSKAVAGLDGASALLCQHILTRGTEGALRGQASFAPGLGLVNRLVSGPVAARPSTPVDAQRLLAAVAINPFLIGVGLPAGSGAVLYPDATLQIHGLQGATLVDGAAITAVDLDAPLAGPDSLPGVRVYHLAEGETFNLETRTLARPAGDDIPPVRGPITSAF